MKRTLSLLTLFIAATSAAAAQTPPSETKGKVVYDNWCVHCHGSIGSTSRYTPNGLLPGTSALTVKYQGRVPAVLSDRTDLGPAYIKSVVRKGLFGMPISRKTEISDADLEDVVAYLTRNRGERKR